jgi:hypothetical protein
MFFIQHPLGSDKLIAARKGNLNLVQTKQPTSSHNRDGLAEQRMMWIVNCQQNMRSV